MINKIYIYFASPENSNEMTFKTLFHGDSHIILEYLFYDNHITQRRSKITHLQLTENEAHQNRNTLL